MSNTKSLDEIKTIIVGMVAEKLHVKPDEIDTETGFIELGIASLAMIEILEELEEAFGELSPTLLFNYPNIDTLADYISKKE